MFSGRRTAESVALLRQAKEEDIYVPALWQIEVADTLAIARRKRRIDAETLAAALALFNELPVHVEQTEDLASISHLIFLSDAFGLTAYDSTSLDLAMRLQLPLATYDQKLAAAARSAGVRLLLPVN